MTRQAPPREVPGAASPLTQTIVAGPWLQALVLARFPSALYLSVGAHDAVLPVVTSDALMLPTAVRLSVAARELEWGVEPGDTVTVGRAEIRLPDLLVRVVREWRPTRVRVWPHLPEPRLLAELADRLSTHVRSPDLMDQATAVCRAARAGDDAEVRRGTRRLLGAGLGLTPSGDDVLCAVLLVLWGVGDPAPIALLGAAVQDRWSATTSLSASLLGAARQGFAVPEVAALVECALRGDLAEAGEALTSTLAIGHSSGQDLVAGLAGSLLALAAPNARPNTSPDDSRTLQPAGRRTP
ncbi:MAG: DUF2877 domain-containing protein [Phycicoccus sp.]|nr:DUF2877 domain-containing protein [Phycicoccus sp.]